MQDKAQKEKELLMSGLKKLGGDIKYTDDHGLEAFVNFKKFPLGPFTFPELKDDPFLLMIYMSILTTFGILYDTDSIFTGLTTKHKATFLISCWYKPTLEYYSFVKNYCVKLFDKNLVKMKDSVYGEVKVSNINNKTISFSETYKTRNGTILFSCHTTFGCVNLIERKISSIPVELRLKGRYIKHNNDVKPRYQAITSSTDSCESPSFITEGFRIGKEHTDYNEHANFTVHICIALKSIAASAKQIGCACADRQIKEISIMWKHESRDGDLLESSSWKDDSSGQFMHISKKGEQIVTFTTCCFYDEPDLKSKL